MTDDFFADMDFTAVDPAPGRLLISEPFLFDPHFKRTVILLTEHKEQGSVGFILNRPTPIDVNSAIEDFPEFDSKICYGGPVSNNSVFYLHTLGDKLLDSMPVSAQLSWGGDFEQLKYLVMAKKATPDDIRFFVGYSGWDAGQLKRELKERSWIVAKCSARQAMKRRSRDFWKTALGRLGKKFEVMSNFPEDPTLN